YGMLYIEQENIPSELFKARIKAQLSRQADTAFVLRADRQAEYGRVVAVLDELKA
ncbi:MAG TPA: biopolymer transporter ExbD, partial [Firmicutes bacterium]|nr:biopolymer transporter ExbD [Bacillota bacterium]